jgi:hypothetical protein
LALPGECDFRFCGERLVCVFGLAVAGGAWGSAVGRLAHLPARRLYQYRHRDAAFRLAREVFAKRAAAEPGRARMVIYVRENCPVCAFYKAVLRPSLEAVFGDALTFEEREAGKEVVMTPLYLISGSVNVLAGELATETAYDQLQATIEAAIGSEESKLKTAGGVYVIGFGYVGLSGPCRQWRATSTHCGAARLQLQPNAVMPPTPAFYTLLNRRAMHRPSRPRNMLRPYGEWRKSARQFLGGEQPIASSVSSNIVAERLRRRCNRSKGQWIFRRRSRKTPMQFARWPYRQHFALLEPRE